MTCFVARVKVKPGREADFERLEAEFSRLACEQQPGTLRYEVLRHRSEAGSYLVYARFADEAAFAAHQAAEFHQRLVPLIMETLGEETDLQFYDWVGRS
jgi:quinol monooxygenase YgiN